MPNFFDQGGQVSNFKLKVSYWYVSHKFQLRTGLIILLIIINLAFYSYSLYRFLVIYLVEGKNFQRDMNSLTANLIDYSYFNRVNKPQDLEILGFDVVDGREGRYDFIAKIKNPNLVWAAEQVSFQLIVNGEVVAEKESFIYPNEEKYVAIFGQEVSGGENPVLKIAQVNWLRYHDFESFSTQRLRFEVSDIEFKSAQESGIRGELPVSILDFKIKNNSAYNYWHVGVNMVLLSAQQVGGANYISLDQFRSGETRDVEMRWYESLPSINQVEIIPEVKISNPDSYMPVE